MLNEIRSGYTIQSDGTVGPARSSRIGALVTGDAQGKYYEQVCRNNVFSVINPSTGTNVSAGNIVGASAAASTQFALWNPNGSGKINSSQAGGYHSPASGSAAKG